MKCLGFVTTFGLFVFSAVVTAESIYSQCCISKVAAPCSDCTYANDIQSCAGCDGGNLHADGSQTCIRCIGGCPAAAPGIQRSSKVSSC